MKTDFNYRKTLENAFAPERAHNDDMGFDLRTPEPFTLFSQQIKTIDLGVSIQFNDLSYLEHPKHEWLMVGSFLKGKSGLASRGLIVLGGVVDGGYTGPIKAVLFNAHSAQISFSRGDKICQLVPILTVRGSAVEVTEVEKRDRGSSGFGSTGR